MSTIKIVSNDTIFIDFKKQIYYNLIILKRRRTTDKTQKFMDEQGIKHQHILEELMKLDVSNYSETDEDYEIRFLGDVWIFGQMYYSEKDRCFYEMYIKIKLVNGVVCMSFHPKEFDIRYPYNP
jgi:hypothetical protein